MTPKEKAEELVGKCKIEIYNEVPALQSNMFHLCILKSSKHCALIAVDEILIAIPNACDYDSRYNHEIVYWQLVKEQIEKL